MRILSVMSNVDELLSREYIVYRADELEDAESIAKRCDPFDCVVTEVSKEGNYPLSSAKVRRSGVSDFIRSTNGTPHIVLSWHNDANLRADFLSWGARYVLEMPCNAVELEAVLQIGSSDPHHLCFGDIRLDILRHDFMAGGKPLRLTAREHAVLEAMMRRPQYTCRKEFIYHRLYEQGEVQMKIVDVFVCKLRKKLRACLGYDPIETVWGVGYRLKEKDDG